MCEEWWFQVSLLYLSQDIYCWIPALTKYKTQPGSNFPLDKIKLRFGHHYPRLIMVPSVFRKLISRVTFNWFVINPLFHYCMCPLFIWRHSLDQNQDLRSDYCCQLWRMAENSPVDLGCSRQDWRWSRSWPCSCWWRRWASSTLTWPCTAPPSTGACTRSTTSGARP